MLQWLSAKCYTRMGWKVWSFLPFLWDNILQSVWDITSHRSQDQGIQCITYELVNLSKPYFTKLTHLILVIMTWNKKLIRAYKILHQYNSNTTGYYWLKINKNYDTEYSSKNYQFDNLVCSGSLLNNETYKPLQTTHDIFLLFQGEF